MAFSDQIATMQAVVYGQYGIAATWTPKAAGVPVPVTLLPDQGDGVADFGAIGRRVRARNVFRVRVSEIATSLAALGLPAMDPAPADTLIVGADSLTIINQPERKDQRRTEWTLEAN
jgi:hypothetical protein